MNPEIELVVRLVAWLPVHTVFTQTELARLVAAEVFTEAISDARITEALRIAAARELIREIELSPGEFRIVRLSHEAPDEPEPAPAQRQAVSDWAQALPRVSEDDQALKLPISTVALRRVILDPDEFVLNADDYRSLFAAQFEPPERRE